MEKLAAFERALMRLDEALALRSDDSMWRDAAIQRFEFTFELGWKALQAHLQSEGSERPGTARQTFRAAWSAGLLEDEVVWLGMLQDRNVTSHTYEDRLAQQVVDRLPQHAAALHSLLAVLKAPLGSSR